MDQKCTHHQRYSPAYPHFAPGSQSLLQCPQCVVDRATVGSELLYTQTITESTDSTVLLNWPPLDDQSLCRAVDEIQQDKCATVDGLRTQVEAYFAELREELLHKLDMSRKNVVIRVNQLSNLGDRVMQTYNAIAQKDELRRLAAEAT